MTERDPLLDYADRTTIVVAFGDIYSDRFDDQTIFEVDGDPPWDQRWLARRVQSAARVLEDGAAVPHDLTITHHYHSWGASGTGHELVLKLAEYAAAGVIGTAASDAIRALSRELVERMRAEGAGYELRPIDAQEAVQRARWIVERRFGRDPDRLQVVSEDHDVDDGEWRVTLRDHTDEFQIEIHLVDGLAVVSRVRRRRLRED